MDSYSSNFEDHIVAGVSSSEAGNEVVSGWGPHSGDTEAFKACGEKVASFKSAGERSLA